MFEHGICVSVWFATWGCEAGAELRVVPFAEPLGPVFVLLPVMAAEVSMPVSANGLEQSSDSASAIVASGQKT